MSGATSRLGLIAGAGLLPLAVAQACQASGRPLFVLRLRGFADPVLDPFVGGEAGIGELGKAITSLRGAGCRSVCFAGVVTRPNFTDLRPDARGLAALPGALMAAREGDEKLLKFLLGEFEREGFSVEGAHEVMAGLTLEAGSLGRWSPEPGHLADLRRAMLVARAIGSLDIGQGAVCCEGLVLAVEAQEGTDAMLQRVAALPTAIRGDELRRRGVLAKACKPMQDWRIDLPTIGPDTVRHAALAGLAGIAGEAGGVLVVERAATVAAADSNT